MIVFRTLVEIMVVIYILLIITNKKYLPRWTPTVIVFTIFTGLYALTSFTAVDFGYAFWGTLERMGGLFSFLHLWVFFIILVSVFRDRGSWEKLLKISIFVGFLSVLFAYGQYFKLGKFFVGWQHGDRVIGTIGNPALFAGYLLFVLFLVIYFLLKQNVSFKEKGFYGAVFILTLPVLHITAVRGSIIAFWTALFLLGLFYLCFLKSQKIKRYLLVGLLIFLILVGFVWLNKDQAWTRKINWVKKITTISLKTSTLQTRLWSWRSGLEGWKERPILGWGPENFVLAHAKHFDSRHFTSIGSETIWDRAHNIILEMLTTMGIIGLLSYLSIFYIIYYLFIKRFREKRIDMTTIGVFGIMLVAYFIHNLFIFDTTANYLLFFLVLGYINFTTSSAVPRDIGTKEDIVRKEKRPNAVLIVVLLILATVLIFKTNIEPAKANYATTRAIIIGRTGDGQKAFEKYQEALSYKSLQGKYEIRHKLATFVIQYNGILRQKGKESNKEMFYYALEEVNKSVEAHPLDYVPYLYIGRIYILSIADGLESAGDQAEASIMKAMALNDKNPRIWYELGQAQLSQKKYDRAIESFKSALALNPNVRESLWFLGMTYAQAGNTEEALKYIEPAIKKGYAYNKSISDISRLINLYSKIGEYFNVVELYKQAIKLRPTNPQFYVSLAVTYARIGDKENAILYANEAVRVDPKVKEQVEEFINSLK